eukprot:217096_1
MATHTEAKLDDNSSGRPFKYGNIDITKVTCDNRKLRIYLDGVFDMTHYGHFRLFKAIKDKFPNSIVVVGVSGDEETIRLKGQTVMNEKERTESIEFCRYVDEVICPCPWIITQPFIDQNSIDYIAHDGEPYVSANAGDIYNFVKKQGRFIATQRTEGISTTGLINRIVCRYNEFVLRNLKRGVTRKELNVSWTRQTRIKLYNQMDILMDNVTKWMDDPHALEDDFLKVFGANGKILQKVKRQRKKILERHPDLNPFFTGKAFVFGIVIAVLAVLLWFLYNY